MVSSRPKQTQKEEPNEDKGEVRPTQGETAATSGDVRPLQTKGDEARTGTLDWMGLQMTSDEETTRVRDEILWDMYASGDACWEGITKDVDYKGEDADKEEDKTTWSHLVQRIWQRIRR